MTFNDVQWCSMMFFDVLWCSMMFYDVLWCFMMFYDVLRCSMMFPDVFWCSMMFNGVLWCSMVLYDVLWYSMMFYDVLCLKIILGFLMLECTSGVSQVIFIVRIDHLFKIQNCQNWCFIYLCNIIHCSCFCWVTAGRWSVGWLLPW